MWNNRRIVQIWWNTVFVILSKGYSRNNSYFRGNNDIFRKKCYMCVFIEGCTSFNSINTQEVLWVRKLCRLTAKSNCKTTSPLNLLLFSSKNSILVDLTISFHFTFALRQIMYFSSTLYLFVFFRQWNAHS